MMGETTLRPRRWRCALDAAVNIIGAQWKMIVLLHLRGGTRRFSELQRAVGDI
jgi:DNA-binding HxlR family transcriptional regulator